MSDYRARLRIFGLPDTCDAHVWVVVKTQASDHQNEVERIVVAASGARGGHRGTRSMGSIRDRGPRPPGGTTMTWRHANATTTIRSSRLQSCGRRCVRRVGWSKSVDEKSVSCMEFCCALRNMGGMKGVPHARPVRIVLEHQVDVIFVIVIGPEAEPLQGVRR